MLSIFYLLLWQLLTLVLSLSVVKQLRTARQLILPTIILLQLIQLLAPKFLTDAWVDSLVGKTILYCIEVAGFGWLLLRYIQKPFISVFTTIIIALQLLMIVLFVLLSSFGFPAFYHTFHLFNAVAILVPASSILYEMLKNPYPPIQRSSFPPIIWVACGVLFYSLTAGFMLVTNLFVTGPSFPAITGWLTMMSLVQHVVLYVFLTVAFVICLTQPPQSI